MGDTGFVRRTKGRFVAPQFFRRNWGDTVSVRRNRDQGSGASVLLAEAAAAMLEETYI
jgi:hypothetical protein